MKGKELSLRSFTNLNFFQYPQVPWESDIPMMTKTTVMRKLIIPWIRLLVCLIQLIVTQACRLYFALLALDIVAEVYCLSFAQLSILESNLALIFPIPYEANWSELQTSGSATSRVTVPLGKLSIPAPSFLLLSRWSCSCNNSPSSFAFAAMEAIFVCIVCCCQDCD